MIGLYPELCPGDLGVVRLGGVGLGNLLLPWARAVVQARLHSLPLVWPTWVQIKPRHLLRTQADGRTYLGAFQRPSEYLGGRRRLLALLSWRRYEEDRLEEALVDRGARSALVTFSGIEGLFGPLRAHRELVARELWRIAHPRQRAMATSTSAGSIAVHVRLGDFAVPTKGELRRGGGYRIPLSWYLGRVRALQDRLSGAPVRVFSDGSDAELRELLLLPGVRRATHGSPLSDLLALARARVLVASASTFSMWASFIGGMPTIWYPGQLRADLYAGREGRAVELEETQPIPEEFWRAIEEPSETILLR